MTATSDLPTPGRLVRGALTGCLLIAIASCGSTPATPTGTGADGARTTTLMLNGPITMPDRLPTGQHTFVFDAAGSGDHTILLVSLRSGVDATSYVEHLNAISTARTLAQSKRGAASTTQDAENLGGALVSASGRTSLTLSLDPGHYTLIDFGTQGIADPHPGITTVHVDGTSDARSVAPTAAATITQTTRSGLPVYDAPAELGADQQVMITNTTDSVQEAALIPVGQSVTDGDLQAFFAGFESARRRPPPFTGAPSGGAPLSPGRSELITLDLKPGRYALVSFAVDPATGRRAGTLGMHKVITVVA